MPATGVDESNGVVLIDEPITIPYDKHNNIEIKMAKYIIDEDNTQEKLDSNEDVEGHVMMDYNIQPLDEDNIVNPEDEDVQFFLEQFINSVLNHMVEQINLPADNNDE